MRELADWNVSRYAEVAAWPLREALWAMRERLKRLAHDAYERQIDRWHHGRMATEMPTLPALLSGEVTGEKAADG